MKDIFIGLLVLADNRLFSPALFFQHFQFPVNLAGCCLPEKDQGAFKGFHDFIAAHLAIAQQT